MFHYDVLRFPAMDSQILIYGKQQPNKSWQASIIRWFLHVEKTWSRFREESELSYFNRQPINQPIKVSHYFYQLLKTAQTYADLTDYLFNPFLASEIAALGYNRSSSHLSTEVSPQKSEFSPIPGKLLFDESTGTVIKTNKKKVDLGGIAKGWAADFAKLWLQSIVGIDSGLVDAGGDLIAWTVGEDTWKIGIQDPFDEKQDILTVEIQNGAVATSNKLHRTWIQNGKKRHHILNGRTGLPAETDVVQATVFASSVVEAEVVTKVLCMHSFNDAKDWAQEHVPHLAYLLVKDDGSIYMSKEISNYIVKGESRCKDRG
jgi:thiamine biosynthesis lipoprotein